MISTRWSVLPADPVRAGVLASQVGIHPVTAQLLLNRRVSDPAAAKRFFTPTLETLSDPYQLPDMAAALARLRQAIAAREPIVIFGDSDVDGLTASVILYEALAECGARVEAVQANRITDGYGLPAALVTRLCRSATRVVILVDCGTNQPQEIAQLAAHGIDTIIVDHHIPLDGWAQPVALINPFQREGMGRELCSAGLSFMLARALRAALVRTVEDDGLELAALGTLSDCAPLTGENRALVAQGLARILESRRRGLQSLCEATKTTMPEPEQITTRLIPRLNASGRLGDSAASWHLLRRDGHDEIEHWLTQADTAHAQTKQLHRRTMAEAQEQVDRLHFRDEWVMVVSRVGWHQGVMGPLAAQLASRYGRPAIAIAWGEDCGIGSGRSIPLFNLLNALKACEGLLVRFGGHAQACGLTVDRKNVERFRAFVNEHAQRAMGREGLVPRRTVDLEMSLAGIQPEWVAGLERFAPFGRGNERPSVLVRNITLEVTSPRIGAVVDGPRRIAARGRFADLECGQRYDAIVIPTLARGELLLSVSDVKGAGGL